MIMTLLGLGLVLKSERIESLPISLCLQFACSKHFKLRFTGMRLLQGEGFCPLV